jgi:hypothetical protein
MLLVYLYLSVYVSPPIVLCVYINDNMSSGTPNHHENMSSGTHSTQGSTSSGTHSDIRDGSRCGERPPSAQAAAGSALGANVSASSSSVEATSSSNQEMGVTQPDSNRGNCFTGSGNAGNLSRTQDRNAASEEQQPPSSVTLSGPLQPALQSSSRRRFGTPEIQSYSKKLFQSIYVSNLNRFTISQVRDFYSWMRLNPTLSHESYRQEVPHNRFARMYMVWTRDYHQQPRPVSRISGITLEVTHSNLLAAMAPFRLTEPGEGWQHDPEQRTYLVSEEMFVYLFMALNCEPDDDVAITQQRASFATSVLPQTGGTQLEQTQEVEAIIVPPAGHLLIEEAQIEVVKQCPQTQLDVLRSFAQAAQVAHELYTVTRNELATCKEERKQCQSTVMQENAKVLQMELELESKRTALGKTVVPQLQKISEVLKQDDKQSETTFSEQAEALRKENDELRSQVLRQQRRIFTWDRHMTKFEYNVRGSPLSNLVEARSAPDLQVVPLYDGGCKNEHVAVLSRSISADHPRTNDGDSINSKTTSPLGMALSRSAKHKLEFPPSIGRKEKYETMKAMKTSDYKASDGFTRVTTRSSIISPEGDLVLVGPEPVCYEDIRHSSSD